MSLITTSESEEIILQTIIALCTYFDYTGFVGSFRNNDVWYTINTESPNHRDGQTDMVRDVIDNFLVEKFGFTKSGQISGHCTPGETEVFIKKPKP